MQCDRQGPAGESRRAAAKVFQPHGRAEAARARRERGAASRGERRISSAQRARLAAMRRGAFRGARADCAVGARSVMNGTVVDSQLSLFCHHSVDGYTNKKCEKCAGDGG